MTEQQVHGQYQHLMVQTLLDQAQEAWMMFSRNRLLAVRQAVLLAALPAVLPHRNIKTTG
jgi:hypothetical protein